MPWQIWTRIATLRYIWTIGIMVHISAPRTQVHLNILERLFTGDRKEECYIGPFCFFFTLLERTSFFLFHFCFSQSIWKNANCQSGLGRFRQSVPPAESPGEQTNAVIHYSPGLGLFWVAQKFNFQGKVETDDIQEKAKRTVIWFNMYSNGPTPLWMA